MSNPAPLDLGQYESVEWVAANNPAPLNLSDTEILDWFAEYVTEAVYVQRTDEYVGGWTLFCDLMTPTKAPTLREAVCLAAAKWNEINDCFLP